MSNLGKRIMGLLMAALMCCMMAQISAVLPPKYLSIKDFKQCLKTKNMGSWEALCMPAQKPTACPDGSWQQLQNLTGADKVPAC